MEEWIGGEMEAGIGERSRLTIGYGNRPLCPRAAPLPLDVVAPLARCSRGTAVHRRRLSCALDRRAAPARCTPPAAPLPHAHASSLHRRRRAELMEWWPRGGEQGRKKSRGKLQGEDWIGFGWYGRDLFPTSRKQGFRPGLLSRHSLEPGQMAWPRRPETSWRARGLLSRSVRTLLSRVVPLPATKGSEAFCGLLAPLLSRVVPRAGTKGPGLYIHSQPPTSLHFFSLEVKGGGLC